MLALTGCGKVHLPWAGRKAPRIARLGAEEDELRDIAEMEASPASVRAPVIGHLVPDNVGLVLETPRRQNLKPPRQQRIASPEIAMRGVGHLPGHRQRRNLAHG